MIEIRTIESASAKSVAFIVRVLASESKLKNAGGRID